MPTMPTIVRVGVALDGSVVLIEQSRPAFSPTGWAYRAFDCSFALSFIVRGSLHPYLRGTMAYVRQRYQGIRFHRGFGNVRMYALVKGEVVERVSLVKGEADCTRPIQAKDVLPRTFLVGTALHFFQEWKGRGAVWSRYLLV